MSMKLHARDHKDFLLPRNLGRKRSAPMDKTPEAATQDMTEQYLRALGVPFLHIPAFLLNAAFSMRGAAPGNVIGAMRHAAEAVRGFPDVIAFDRSHGRFLAIELKSARGKMTSAQEMWMGWLGTKLCRTFEEAKIEIDKWMKGIT